MKVDCLFLMYYLKKRYKPKRKIIFGIMDLHSLKFDILERTTYFNLWHSDRVLEKDVELKDFYKKVFEYGKLL